MALPTFDKLKHHVGLGSAVGTKYGFIVEGDYREMLQNSPRITAFGSQQELFDAPSLSRWTQDNFLGGAYWVDWTAEDNGVFGSSVNMLPTGQGSSLRTTPPMTVYDDESPGTAITPWGAIGYGNWLISTWDVQTVRLDVDTGTRTAMASTYGVATGRGRIESGQLDTPVLWTPVASIGVPKFERRKLSDWSTLTQYNAPAGYVGLITGMEFGAIVPVVGFGSEVWSMILSTTDATQPTFTKIGRMPGRWRASCSHNQMAMILVTDGDFKTFICQTDGSSMQTLVEFPFNFQGRAIASYGGRLYVLGVGYDFNGDEAYVEFYEITGGSLRTIKTWAPERRLITSPLPGVDDMPITGDSMCVHEGLLFLGVISKCLIAYDVINDALYSGPQLQDVTQSPYSNTGASGDWISIGYFAGASVLDYFVNVEFTNVTNYVYQTGDYLEYEINQAPNGVTTNKKTDIQLANTDTTDSATIGGTWVDQNGRLGYEGDLSAVAFNVWHARKLAIPASWVGKTMDQPYIHMGLDTPLENTWSNFRNIRITNGSGTLRKTIYASGDSPTFNAFSVSGTAPTWTVNVIFGDSVTHRIQSLFTFRGRLTAFVRNQLDYAKYGYHHIARLTSQIAGSYTGEVITSDFAPEPGLAKRWSSLYLLTRYGSSNPTVDYSVDAGVTWTAATLTHTTNGNNRTSIADLSSATVARSMRFRIRLPRGTNVTDFTELRAFTLSFSFLESGKRSWALTINDAERIEDVAGETMYQDVSGVHDQLWAWCASQTPLFYTDIDGEAYKVSLTNLQQRTPRVSPPVDGDIRESFLTLTLVEA